MGVYLTLAPGGNVIPGSFGVLPPQLAPSRAPQRLSPPTNGPPPMTPIDQQIHDLAEMMGVSLHYVEMPSVRDGE